MGFKLPMSFYLIGEYTQVHTSRKRDDVPVNDDYIYGADAKVERGGFHGRPGGV